VIEFGDGHLPVAVLVLPRWVWNVNKLCIIFYAIIMNLIDDGDDDDGAVVDND
jgi:hypothetical protein